jgi:phosphoribosylglycinamide formyltransferase-1
MQKIAIFASGAGSNALRIIEHFHHHPAVTVELIACNKPGAGVLNIARDKDIDSIIIEKEQFFRGNAYLHEFIKREISFIVLAGFLWKVPETLIRAFPGRIINIHPALLPKYGGRGMYGNFVHSAVISGQEKETGITIHYVDELYDNGDIIFQATCPVLTGDTPDSLAHRIHALEHFHYPRVIEKILTGSTEPEAV